MAEYKGYGTKEDKEAYWAWLDKTYGWVAGRGVATKYGGGNPTFQHWVAMQAGKEGVAEAYEPTAEEEEFEALKKESIEAGRKVNFSRQLRTLLDRAQAAGLPYKTAEEIWNAASARKAAGAPVDISDYKKKLAKRLNISGDFEQGLAERTEAFGEREWRVEQAQAAAGRKRAIAEAWRYAPPSPEFPTAWYKTTAGLEGTEPWRTWFKEKYGDILGRFKAEELPEDWQTAAAWGTVKEKVSGWRQLKAAGEKYEYRRRQTPAEAEAKIEKGWAEYLKVKTPEYREKWWGLGPAARGEKPWAYQPAIRTVSF